MLNKIKALKEEIEQASVSAKEEVEELRIKYISKKGLVGQLFNEFKDVPAEIKKEVGQAAAESAAKRRPIHGAHHKRHRVLCKRLSKKT